ncbi:MAG: hypothetical protein IJK23_10035 [Clostridia bacterium]|nr:hypothetical protein [Clostridia bacterium]
MTETEIVERLTRVEQSVKSAQHQIDETKELVGGIHELASEVKYMREDLSEVKKDVGELKSKPAKRYDLIVTGIISALTSGAVGYLIAQLIK